MEPRIFEIVTLQDVNVERFLFDSLPYGTIIINISDEVAKLRRLVVAFQNESDTRVPKGLDQKTDEYVDRVRAHTMALMELTQALHDVGYREWNVKNHK